MSNFDELFLVLALAALGAAYYVIQRFVGWFRRGRLKDCDYLVFEAYPGHLPLLQSDLAVHGWHLASTEPTDSGSLLYRFVKASGSSTSLSEIFDFERSMPGTADRHEHAHLPIKIHSYGMTGRAHAAA